MTAAIKTILAVMLFVCLANMPYGYYELVRYSAMTGFSLLAYGALEKKHNRAAIIYLALALLFQPFFKIPLGHDIWIIVDLIVAGGLIITLRRKS